MLETKVRSIPKINKGIKGYTKNGGEITITEIGSGGGKNLSQDEMNVYAKAQLLCSEKNGSQWLNTIELLEGVGFQILWR